MRKEKFTFWKLPDIGYVIWNIVDYVKTINFQMSMGVGGGFEPLNPPPWARPYAWGVKDMVRAELTFFLVRVWADFGRSRTFVRSCTYSYVSSNKTTKKKFVRRPQNAKTKTKTFDVVKSWLNRTRSQVSKVYAPFFRTTENTITTNLQKSENRYRVVKNGN